jgi:lantibiotic modifying enzyme
MGIKTTPLGDLHNGRQTCLIQTQTEVYIQKPRSSKNEEAFDLFCRKLTELGVCEFARAPRIIRKGENEHIQSVEKNETTDNIGADLYYKRAGVLLFFAYLLCSNSVLAQHKSPEVQNPPFLL